MGQASKQVGVQRQRATPKKSYRFPEVVRAAAAAEESLRRDVGDAEWIGQAIDGLEVYLQRCVESFAGTPTPRNMGPISTGDDYREYARTAQEIKETMAAEEGATSRAPQRLPRYRHVPDEIQIPENELADPLAPPRIVVPKKGDGWAL